MPEVVAITVHLTFARRAFELAEWYRARGAKVVLGGLHVLSCPEECAPHADALALGDGVQLWPRILRDIEARRLQSRYVATYENDYSEDPAPRRSILPRHGFLTTTSLIATRGCHNRCGFCYLATDGLRMPYRMRQAAASGGRICCEWRALRGVHRQQSRVAARLPACFVCRAAAAEQDLECGGHDRCDRRSVAHPQYGACGMHGSVHRVRVPERRQPFRRA